MAKFLNQIESKDIGYAKDGKLIRELTNWLIWAHGNLRRESPPGFQCDGASVPRLPIIFYLWGDKAHREGFGHDNDYRIDSEILVVESEEVNLAYPSGPIPEKYIIERRNVPKPDADLYFRMTIKDHEHPQYGRWIYDPMYLAVKMCGGPCYHRMKVMDKFPVV